MIIHMDIIFVIIIYIIVGLCIGSFAGAVAWRLHERKDFVSDRSECEHCHHKLSVLDLIPVFSWVFLAGRCRYCKKPIGMSALAVELFGAVAFVASYLAWPFGFDNWLPIGLFVLWLVAVVFMAILFVYDLRWKLLPDRVTFPLIILGGLFFVGKQILLGTPLASWPLELILGLLPVAGLYMALYVVSHGKWVGLGDVKFGILIGLVLSWQSGLVALFLANLIGSAYILPQLALGNMKRSTKVPFGPFLIIATVIAFLWGREVIDWYTRLLSVGSL
ncbi:prepilin peptidase [Candidatus Saccharibacteria bacterium]|nr:prepilin peptidase [Candidatus Saccharibacteria bacterium]